MPTDNARSFPEEPLPRSVITLGNFDGLHIAHQALLNALVEEGAARSVPSVALTFFPHPGQFLRPGSGVHLLFPIEERVRRIHDLGVDHVIVLRFDETLSELAAEEFVAALEAAFHPSLFVIGPDTRFGRQRKGDAALLKSIGDQNGFDVLALGTVSVDGQRISSSGIRRSLSQGDVSTPRRWCKAPFLVEGRVVYGAGRGRTLGFRTANIQTDWPTTPAPGVYVVRSIVQGGACYFGVANIGTRPTFENPATASQSLEVHLLAEDVPDLYGHVMRVEFLKRLRGEKRFADANTLVEHLALAFKTQTAKKPLTERRQVAAT